MKRKLEIGIIGAGNIGAALTRHFTRLGHDVVVANSRGPESLAGLAKENVPASVLTFDTFPRKLSG
jgi:predicted dinucleotide-binding enzyme